MIIFSSLLWNANVYAINFEKCFITENFKNYKVRTNFDKDQYERWDYKLFAKNKIRETTIYTDNFIQKNQPSLKDIKKSKYLGADCVEIHTGKFCNLINKNLNFKKELNKIKKAVALGNKLGLEVHAGHGLTFKSAKILSKISGIKEFNIGHFLVGESIFIGLKKTIKIFRRIVK